MGFTRFTLHQTHEMHRCGVIIQRVPGLAMDVTFKLGSLVASKAGAIKHYKTAGGQPTQSLDLGDPGSKCPMDIEGQILLLTK